MMQHDSGPALDAREQLRRWDGGGTIWTIDMGGMGPGYEQAIQTLAIEIVRDEIDKPLPQQAPHDWGDTTVSRIDAFCGGFSGAQVGAAKQLAWSWLKIGPAAVQSKPELQDRKIQASNFWPRVPPTLDRGADPSTPEAK